MSTTFAPPRVPPAWPSVESADPPPSPDLSIARYADREIRNARATAKACATVARLARSQGRSLVAGVLCDFAAEFTDEAVLLAPATRPGVRWPCPAVWQVTETDLDEAIDAISDLLQHSERTLRWIARRPDLPSPMVVAFDALACARHARRSLLRACSEIDAW